MKDEDIYKEAAKNVEEKKGFFYHLLAYVCVITMLTVIMYFENEGKMLPVIIVSLSWGIGLASHYLKTFGTENLDFLGINPYWEEEELEHEIERLRRKRELKEQLIEEKNLLDDLEELELKEIRKNPLENNE